jgi:predicted TIM-barrel fold metal-dependent hydrolase
MRIDVNLFLGSYPWRRVPGTSTEAALRAMDRAGIDRAWVTHLPGLFWRDPAEGNTWLYQVAEREARFRPVPAVHPGLPRWEYDLSGAREARAPAVRCDPTLFAIDPVGPEMRALVSAAGDSGIPILLAVRLEDGRQRHPNDRAPELTAAAVRTLVRSHPATRFVVTHADRNFVQEVHFGSTPEEAARIWWDICWLWGPPEDHLETLLATVGADRFVFGTGLPLRIPENAIAKLDLLDLEPGARAAIEHRNAERAEAG